MFALVWDRPSTVVAVELGISGVALGKLCRRLQVPKPPRGYWARVASAKIPKKPPLPAYRAEIEKHLRTQAKPTGHIHLSKLQLKFLWLAIDELRKTGVDTTGYSQTYDGIQSAHPELIAKILIVIQSRHEKWLKDRSTPASLNGALSSLSNLVEKLQPHAKEQILIFHEKSQDHNSHSNRLAITIRATDDLLRRMAQLSRLTRSNGLAYVVADMSSMEHAWSVHQVFPPSSYTKADTRLCVSSHEIWIQANMRDSHFRYSFESIRMALQDICPIDLIPAEEQRLPCKIRLPLGKL